MPKTKIRCAVEELNGKLVCYIHGAKSWKDFDPLVRILELGLKVRSVETVEGPDMQVAHRKFKPSTGTITLAGALTIPTWHGGFEFPMG